MTECTDQVTIGKAGRRSIVSEFDGGEMTSDAGACLLGAIDRRLNLTSRIAACFFDRRDATRVQHSMVELVRQRVFAMAMGYEDLNDHLTLRQDAVLRLLAGRTPEDGDLASPSTLCRFENGGEARLIDAMNVLIDVFIAAHRSAPSEPIILDVDASADMTHGEQERFFFNGFYDGHCFLPLFIFCGEHLLFSWLRPSSRSAAYNARAALSLVVRRLREKWPNVSIIVRGDAGFAVPKLLDWCDDQKIDYIIGFAKNPKLDGLIDAQMQRARSTSEETGDAARVYTSFRYRARSWPRQRRVIAKAEWLRTKPNPRYVVTSLHGRSKALYEDAYCARGDMENRLKEQQYGLFSDRTSCHAFRANQVRLALSAVAYTLIAGLRRIALQRTRLARAQAWIIRTRLFKVAARVVVTARRIRLKLSETWPYADLIRRAAGMLLPRAHGPPDWRTS